MHNLPTLLTLTRLVGAIIVMPPLLVYMLPRKDKYSNLVAVGIFGTLALTDFFDGYLARLWHQQSTLGAWLDPLADKFLVVGALIPLIFAQRVGPAMGIIIIGRELFVTSLRELALLQGFTIPVLWAGKLKTAVQLVYLAVVILNNRPKVSKIAHYCEQLLALATIFFTLYSGLMYYHSYIYAH